MIISKLYRFIVGTFELIASYFRILHFRIMYPGIKIDFGSYLGSNVSLKCFDGGTLIIRNSSILSGTSITVDHTGFVEINDTFIGLNCVIACRDNIKIQSHCQIAEMVVIRDQDHNFGQPGLTIEQQGFSSEPIVIGRNVWLAAKVTILKGVVIGDNAVIGASSVIRSNVEPGSVYVGIPGRRVK